ncbi:MAG: 5'-nucleotidase C-terminal domain-containing protein [Gemmatimonadetes bacterium]|nr:5'-nucleotidase C-terminal domain-containing protein [Gemmatimonadota bacterium]
MAHDIRSGTHGTLRAAALRPLARIIPLLALGAAACGGRAAPPTPAPRPTAPAAEAPAAPDTFGLVLLGTTDEHGRIYPYDYYTGQKTSYGLALLAPLVDSVRRANPGRTYLFGSGDILQGNPLAFVYARLRGDEPNPIIRAMNLMAYDAVTIGNHEYNYGIPVLEKAVREARFPVVSANIFRHATDEHAFAPYVLLPKVVAPGDTILIGVTGNTPPGVAVWDRATVEGRQDFRDVVASLKPVVAEMRAKGADVVVVLSHGGLEGTSYDTAATGVPAENASVRVAREVPGVDVIFMGHTHRELADTTIAGVLLTQAKNWAASLADVELTLRRRGPSDWTVVRKRGTILRPDPQRADTALLDSLRWAHERTVAYVNAVVGRSTARMDARRARVEDTPILDFINEVQRKVTGADLSATAAFTLSAKIPEGPITMADIAGLYIYDNTLKAIRITGRQLREYLEKSAEYYRGWPAADGGTVTDFDVPGYNFDVVSGVDYTIDLSKPVGRRITSLTYHGRPVTPEQTFTLALNNYRQTGGGGYAMIAGAPVVYDRQQDIRELLVEEIRRRGTIRPGDYFHRNWRIVPAAAAARALAEQTAREPGPRAAPAPPTRLRVVATTDLHGHLLPEAYRWSGGREVGGAATLAAYFRLERAGFGGPTVLLDGGDVMQGTPISNLVDGRSSVGYFNAVGYRGVAVGNHEYDWGVPTLRARIGQAEWPWLAANAFVAGADTAPSWLRPTALVDVDGVKVGVIGLSTQETPTTTKAENVRGLEFRSGAAAIDRWVPELRRRGADFVIVVAHSGALCDSTGRACRGEIVDWAAAVHEKPDLIVAGHTHRVVRTVVNGVPIVQAGYYGQHYAVVDLERATPDAPARAWIRDIPVAYADRVAPDSGVAALVERYRREVGPKVEARIATLAEALPRGRGEYPLGRLIADAQRRATGAQVAFMNNGGIRTDLPAGPVTWERLYELSPFGNRLVVLTLTGAKLREAIEQAVRGGEPGAQLSGVVATYDPTRPPGSRVVSLTLSDGQPVRDDAAYTVAVNDFLAGQGDAFTAFANPVARKDTGIVDLDALIEYLKALPQPVRAPADPRLQVAAAAASQEREPK